jgi:hypothetical protein
MTFPLMGPCRAIALFLAAANLCTVPAAVQRDIVRRFPGYRLPVSTEAAKQDDHCQYVARADFDCNKMDDYALLIEHKDTGRVLLVTSLTSKKGNLVEVHRVGDLGKIAAAHLVLVPPPKVKGASRCKAVSFGDKTLYRAGNEWKVAGNPAAGKP